MKLITVKVIEKIYHHHLSKKRRFHPALVQRLGLKFCEKNLSNSKTNMEIQHDLYAINDFVKNYSVTSIKMIIELCQQLNPAYITGFYNTQYQIEVFAYHRRNLYMCQHTLNLGRTHYLSKKKLYQLYSFPS